MTSSVAVFPPGFRVTDASDNPISGATIEFYAAGTNTPKSVYSDKDLATAIGTSLATDSGGYPSSGGNKVLVYTNTSPYKIVIKDSLGATLITHDNVQGAVEGTGTGGGTGSGGSVGFKVGDVKLSLASTPDAGFVRLIDTPQALIKADYPDLNAWASAQGYPWGSTATTFNVPPAGGYLLRFASSGSTIDPSGPRAPGSTQLDAIRQHNHTVTVTDPGHDHSLPPGYAGTSFSASNEFLVNANGVQISNDNKTGANTTGISVSLADFGDAETRPKNVAMYADMLAVPALVSTQLIGANGFTYEFNGTANASDIIPGKIGLNNLTQTSATKFYINETDNLGSNLTTVIQALPSGSQVYITKVGTPSVFLSFVLSSGYTDSGTYDEFNITSVATSSTPLADGDVVSIVVMRSGLAGAPGADPGLRWTFETSNTMSAPATGALRLNSPALSSATAAAIAATSAETGNPNVLAFLNSWDESTTTGNRGQLLLRKSSAPENFAIYAITASVTDNTSWVQLTLSHIVSAGSFSASDVLSAQFYRTGDKGTDGVGAGDVVGPAGATDGHIVLFNGSTGKLVKKATFSGTVQSVAGLAQPAVVGLVDVSTNNSVDKTGATSAASSLQTAITNVCAAGGVPHLPDGIYDIGSATITVPANGRVVCGLNAIIRRTAEPTTPAPAVDLGANALFEGGIIDNYVVATSTTSNSIGTGSKTFTVQSGLSYTAGAVIYVWTAANTWMQGTVTSYSGTSLVLNITTSNGSGTFTSWKFTYASADNAAIRAYNNTGARIVGTKVTSSEYKWQVGVLFDSVTDASAMLCKVSGAINRAFYNYRVCVNTAHLLCKAEGGGLCAYGYNVNPANAGLSIKNKFSVCDASNMAAQGFELGDNTFKSSLDSCTADTIANTGFLIQVANTAGFPSYNTITSCIANNCIVYGFNLAGCFYNQLTGCQAVSCGTGLIFGSGQITGGTTYYAQLNTVTGFRADAGTTTGSQPGHGIRFIGSTLRNGCTGVSCIANAGTGILLDAGAQLNRISGNAYNNTTANLTDSGTGNVTDVTTS